MIEIIRSEYPGVTNFERAFPSLCFALATPLATWVIRWSRNAWSNR